jgi:hypothetical protein
MRKMPKPSAFEQVGDYCFVKTKEGRVLWLAIPVTSSQTTQYDKKRFVASRWTIDHKNHCDAQWSWNGDQDKPTLKPSLHAVGDWHGWVRDGKMVEA